MTNSAAPDRLGRLPADWRVMPLGAVTERAVEPLEVETDKLYREIGIRSHGKGIFHKELVKGATLGAKRVFRVVPNRLVFNIVFAWEGAVAVTSMREQGMIASHRFPMLGPSRDGIVDVEYLRRFFQTRLGVQLLGDASPGGAGRNRTLNQKFAAEIPIPVPPLAEQRKIAAILASVDEAIEATQAIIDQLQVVKKAMMAELLTRGPPGRHTRFKETDIGKVPEEWEHVELGTVLEGIDAGWSPLCEGRLAAPDEWGVLKVSAVTSGRYLELEHKALPAALKPRSECEVRAGDVLFARANGVLELVGRTVLVRTTRPRLMLSDKLLRLRPISTRLEPSYLTAALATDAIRGQLLASTGGSDMRNISQASLRALRLPLPSIDEQRLVSRMAEGIDYRLESEQSVLAAIRQLKSALMSVLLTGEVRVTPDPDPA